MLATNQNSLERYVILLTLLLAVSSTLQHTKHVCKHYLNHKYFDFTPMTKHTKREWQGHIIETDLCNGLSLDDYAKANYTYFDHCLHLGLGKPNAIVARGSNLKLSILGCTEVSMNNITAEWYAEITQIPWRFGFGRDSSREVVTLSHDIHNTQLQGALGIDKLSFNITCQDTPFEDTGSIMNRLYLLIYSGPGGCALPVKDYTGFYQNNFLFLVLMALPSLVGVFLTKEKERLAMSLAGVQAAVMVVAGICVHIDNEPGATADNSFYYSIAACASGLLVFGLSYFSRTISILFVSLGLNYAINWTCFYLFSLVFSSAISFKLFAICISIGIPVVIGISYYCPRARERYSFGIYTSVTYSFYLVTSVAIALGYYLDVLTFQKYGDFGKTDIVQWKHWACIPVQLILTIGLALAKCNSIKGNENALISTIDSQMVDRKSVKDVEEDLLAHAYRPDHEINPRLDIGRDSNKKTIIAM